MLASTKRMVNALVLAVLALGTGYAVAYDTGGTVALSGTVGSTLHIASVPTTLGDSAATLPLDGEGTASTHMVKVSDFTISTNNFEGFTLTASSGNILGTVSATATPISFQVGSVANDVAADAGDFTIATGSNYTFSTTDNVAVTRDLFIKYTPAALQDPGAYTGSIILSVSNN